MIRVQWFISRTSCRCFLCGMEMHRHAAVQLTAARKRQAPDAALAITQASFCRACFEGLREAAERAPWPCSQGQKAA